MICERVAMALRAARIEKGLTQRDVANASGLHKYTVSRAEKVGMNNLDSLCRLAAALDMQLSEIIRIAEGDEEIKRHRGKRDPWGDDVRSEAIAMRENGVSSRDIARALGVPRDTAKRLTNGVRPLTRPRFCKTTDEERRAFVRMWESGYPIDLIAHRTGLKPRSVSERARRWGLQSRARWKKRVPMWPVPIREKAIEMVADGLSARVVGYRMGVPRSTVQKWVLVHRGSTAKARARRLKVRNV